MVTIFTIGFAKKSLKDFAEILDRNRVSRIIDTRLRRDSQLSGFAKSRDLKYILEETLKIRYEIVPEFSPTEGLLKTYRKDKDWEKYAEGFRELIKDRKLERFKDKLVGDKAGVCLLCSEAEADKCHRRLLAEFFCRQLPKANIVHL